MSTSELTSEIQTFYFTDLLFASTAALTMYEYVSTFDGEVSYIWRRKKTVPTIILLAIRWTMVLRVIISIPNARTSMGCEALAITGAVLLAFNSTLTAAFSGLRAYALWGCNRALFIVIFLLGLPTVAVALYNLNGMYAVHPVFGCIEDTKYSVQTAIALIRAERIPAVLGDIFLIGATWAKSYQQLREARSLGMSLPLSTLLLQDGTVYFLIIFALDVAELCPNLPHGGEIVGYMAAYLPPILINRFILNLRQLSDVDGESAGDLRTIPTLRISVDVAGNMGEPLEFGGNREDDPDAEERPSGRDQSLADPRGALVPVLSAQGRR